MELRKLIKSKRNEILKIASKHGAENLRLFGSTLQGEKSPDSDIDFLVDVGPNRSPFFPGGLVMDLEDLLGQRVDVVTPQALHWYIRDKILKQAVPV